MSAYIVSDETIDAIVNHYRHDHRSNDMRGWLAMYTNEMTACGPGPGNDFWAMLGSKLRAMNERAIISRYGEESLNMMTGADVYVPYVYSNTTPRPLHQGYGALQCYLYQCSEGSVPEENLYNELDGELNSMARQLVRQLAERCGISIPWGV